MNPRKLFTPYKYQELIAAHILEHPRCAIWASMGMGKTPATLSALDSLALVEDTHPTLILAPLRVAKTTWPDEVKKWEHLRGYEITPIVGSVQERIAALRIDTPIYSCNYDNLVWLVEHFGDRWPFRTVVSDESIRLKSLRLSFRTAKKKDGTPGKTFLAGQGGKRAGALGRIAHTKIKRFIQLTGAPAPNGLADLWGQMWMLDAGQRLGRTYEAFKQRWFQKSFDGYSISTLPTAQEQIQDRLRDICLTIRDKDWFDLQEPLVKPVYVDIPVKARQLYRDMEREMFMRLEEHDVEAFGAAAKTMKCLQIANGAAYIDDKQNWKEIHDQKLQALESIVSEANGEPVMVAYHFKSDLARLMKAFPNARILANEDGMRDFKSGKYTLGLGHPASMGHGVDGLQEHCHIGAFFGHWWDLDQRDQFIARIGPMRQFQAGKDVLVRIYNIIARDTIDEVVIARHETKRDVQDLLLDAMKRRK